MRKIFGPVLFWILATAIPTAVLPQNTVTIGTSPTADVSDWSDEFCVADPPPDCDDFPNQQDAKGACIASNYVAPGPADTAFLRFDFDEIGRNGANTIDGCWLVDVNQNGLVERALCFSVASTGGVASSVVGTLFTCNDSAATTCGNDMAVASSATCALNNATPDAQQLADCAVGDLDLAVECSVLLTDMGWTTGAISLIQGCSSTSAQPNSATFDCFGSPTDPLVIDPENGMNLPIELVYFTVE